MDQETLANEREGQMIQNFTQSEGWMWIKDRIMEEIMDLQSIKNLVSMTDPEQVLLDIKSRNSTIDILVGIITKIEGRAEQHANNNQPIQEGEEYILIKT